MKRYRSFIFAFIFCSVLLSLLISCSGKRSDTVILNDINDSLKAKSNSYSEVSAEVNDGKVSLSGTCLGENCADSLSQLVTNIDGVKDVENNVQQGQTATDLTLRTSVQTIVSKYQGVQGDVTGGIIVLRGLIQRDQLQPLMNELGSLEAKKIDNQLAVQ